MLGDRDDHVPGDRPLEIITAREIGDRLRIQDRAVGGARDLDLLARPSLSQSSSVERDVVRLTVVEIDCDREAGAGIPGSGDAVIAARGLEGASVGRRGGPGVGRLLRRE